MQHSATALEYARQGLLRPMYGLCGLSAWPHGVQQLKRGWVPVVIDVDEP